MSSTKNISSGVQIYGATSPFSNSITLIRDVLVIFSTLENIKRLNSGVETKNILTYEYSKTKRYLRPRLIDVLVYYIIYDYGKEAKEIIKSSLRLDIKNLNQINAELTEKGYLVRDKYNNRMKALSPELKDIREYFLTSEGTPKSALLFFGIKFKNNA